jgi:hypothetical protein
VEHLREQRELVSLFQTSRGLRRYAVVAGVPGHNFLDHATADLASFLQIAMLNRWGGYVLTEADDVNVFFSHDEYIDFYSKQRENLPDVATALAVESIRRET